LILAGFVLAGGFPARAKSETVDRQREICFVGTSIGSSPKTTVATEVFSPAPQEGRTSDVSWAPVRHRELANRLELSPPRPLPRPDNLATRPILLRDRGVEAVIGYGYRRASRLEMRTDPALGTIVDERRRVDEEYYGEARLALPNDWELGLRAAVAGRKEGRPTFIPFDATTAADAVENRFRVEGLDDFVLRLGWQRLFRLDPLWNVSMELAVKLRNADGNRPVGSDLALGTGQKGFGLAFEAKREFRRLTLAAGMGIQWRACALVEDFSGALSETTQGDSFVWFADVLGLGRDSWYVPILSFSGWIGGGESQSGLLHPLGRQAVFAVAPGLSVHLIESLEMKASYRIPVIAKNLTSDGQGYDVELKARF
jgi:hypothetical protein